MGIDSATRLAERLSTAQISELTLLGVCGGLVPGLEIGDVVCANASCIQLSNGQTQCIDTPLTPQLQAAVGEMHGEFKIHYGRVICTTSVILSSRKRDLAESSGASAVEMESAPLAQWALSAGIPFNHIRVVVDCWDSHPLLLQPLSIVRELARGIPKIRESCRALRILARLSRTLFRASSARL